VVRNINNFIVNADVSVDRGTSRLDREATRKLLYLGNGHVELQMFQRIALTTCEVEELVDGRDEILLGVIDREEVGQRNRSFLVSNTKKCSSS
jgi:hypothetical protein